MPVDSKVGRRHWGWLILLVTFRKFQHFNLVSKIFQKLLKPLPCHKSIGKMLHAICISAVAVSLRWASCGPWASCYYYCFSKKPWLIMRCWWGSSSTKMFLSYFSTKTCYGTSKEYYIFMEKYQYFLVEKSTLSRAMHIFIFLWHYLSHYSSYMFIYIYLIILANIYYKIQWQFYVLTLSLLGKNFGRQQFEIFFPVTRL